MMNWLINNPIDALQLLWGIVLKPCVYVCVPVCLLWMIITKICTERRIIVRRLSISAMVISVIVVGTIRVYQFAYPALNTDSGHENYSAYFNDTQIRQISAAQKYGIAPIKDRTLAEEAIKSGKLVRITSCREYQLAPMRHSIPYLTRNASDLLKNIGENFRDSLNSKGLCDHKIVVTSVLRTDADVERLMKTNRVAVKNSAHRHATTFDISYVSFIPIGLNFNTDRGELKKVLAEVLSDLREQKNCYVRYESSQSCFHITFRR